MNAFIHRAGPGNVSPSGRNQNSESPKLTNNPHVTAAFHVPFNWVCLANQQVCFSADSITYTHTLAVIGFKPVFTRPLKKSAPLSPFPSSDPLSPSGSLKFQPTHTNPTHVRHIAGSTESKQKDPSNHTHAGHNVILHMRPGPHTHTPPPFCKST